MIGRLFSFQRAANTQSNGKLGRKRFIVTALGLSDEQRIRREKWSRLRQTSFRRLFGQARYFLGRILFGWVFGQSPTFPALPKKYPKVEICNNGFGLFGQVAVLPKN